MNGEAVNLTGVSPERQWAERAGGYKTLGIRHNCLLTQNGPWEGSWCYHSARSLGNSVSFLPLPRSLTASLSLCLSLSTLREGAREAREQATLGKSNKSVNLFPSWKDQRWQSHCEEEDLLEMQVAAAVIAPATPLLPSDLSYPPPNHYLNSCSWQLPLGLTG